jgi:hypothetical protein
MNKYIFSLYPRDEFGIHIPSQKKIVKILRTNVFTAKEFLYTKYPKRQYFIELDSIETYKSIDGHERKWE